MVASKKDNKRVQDGNILLVANYESDVGYAWWLMENFWIQIARHFSEQGRQIFLIYPKITMIPKHLHVEPIIILEHDFSDKSIEAMRRLKAIVKGNRISSVYLTDREYYSVRYLMLRKWGVSRIVLHDHTPGERPSEKWYKKIIKSGIYLIPGLSCDLFIGVSRFVYDRLIENGCVPRSKCAYVLNGILPINIEDRNRYIVHDEFGVPRDAMVIVSTGRATFYKGIDFIIKCADKLINQQKEENIYFLFCGDGPDLNTFKRMVVELGISKRFIFAEKRSDVPKLLQSCNIGIQASKGEAFSLSILEYMSAGLATVVPAHCGNKEAIIHGENGMLYTPGDIEMAVRILKELVHDEEVRKKIGTNAVKTVKDKFNIEMTNKDFIECLKDRF